ncbi:MAG: SDR family NAD(P)-dependent oxidoreductase [Nannocystaceae bacterium]|nr:SDR family NAD(P)-dependent oxidoreductase [Nannocystaceae bacterium]
MEIRDRVVFVTGASRGIGLEIARALARAGARVVLAARSLPTLQAEAARIVGAGGDALAVELDVTSESSVAAAVATAHARFGAIDVLVNDAGNAGEMTRWETSDAEFTRAMFDVHVLGAERVIRAVLPGMIERGRGTIVNFASTVAWVPMPGAAAYSAAKAAVVSLSQALRAELAEHGIDVRLFAPPHTSTEAGKAMPLDLPKIFAPQWVAEQFLASLRSDRARSLPGGNGMLLLVQRVWPSLATRIMNGLGFRALTKALARRDQAAIGP